MQDLAILNQMIKETAKIFPSQYYQRMKVELVESMLPESSTTIYGVPENAIIIKVDAFSSPDSVFKGSQGECKRADYVIISTDEGKRVIIYIEMKKTRGNPSDIVKQLKGAQCFIAYCREIGKSFWDKKNFLKDYQQRFVSIGQISISKRKTRISRETGKHDQPEKMLKIDWPHHIQFQQLAGQ